MIAEPQRQPWGLFIYDSWKEKIMKESGGLFGERFFPERYFSVFEQYGKRFFEQMEKVNGERRAGQISYMFLYLFLFYMALAAFFIPFERRFAPVFSNPWLVSLISIPYCFLSWFFLGFYIFTIKGIKKGKQEIRFKAAMANSKAVFKKAEREAKVIYDKAIAEAKAVFDKAESEADSKAVFDKAESEARVIYDQAVAEAELRAKAVYDKAESEDEKDKGL